MIGDDDRLPTRDGTPSGKANERQMFERGGMSVSGFRTDFRGNLDGTTTMLRTRGGAPEFSTLPAKKKIAISVARGFVAYAPGNSYAALFDPYTLAIENKRFQLTSVTYHVGDVAETPYLPRKWFDVWSWDDADVRINGQIAKSFFPFRFPAVQKALPFLVPWPTPPIYGDKYRNGPLPKRMFAVGPTAVGLVTDPMWDVSDAPIAVLSPKTPRAERKALVCGQSIDRQNATAYLAQLYFTGQTWDSLFSAWYHSTTRVAMLVTPSYLMATNNVATVDLPIPVFSGPASSSGTMSTDTTLPATEIALVGHGEVAATIPYASNVVPPGGGGNVGYYSCRFNFDGTESRQISGVVDASYTRLEYQCHVTDSEIECGKSLDFSGTNRKVFDTRSETTRIPAQTIALYSEPVDLGSNTLSASMTGDFDKLYWGGWFYYLNPPSGPLNDGSGPGPNRGTPNKDVGNISIPGTSATRQYEEQSGSFSVRLDGYDIVKVDFSHNKSTGQKAVLTPRQSTTYASILAQPPSNYYNVWSGIGVYNGPVRLSAYSDPATAVTWIESYHAIYHGSPYDQYTQPDEAVDTINEKYSALRSRFVAQKLYDSENSNGDTTRSGDPYYTASVDPSITLETHALNWTTRDFILHDDANEVYITVDGTFSATKSYGASATATLTIVILINTPWGSGSKTLYELPYTYGNMLPEEEIDAGKTAIPSPQIRAIFIPKYREQGSFFGAAYITKAEVANGATPAVLVNFVLSLETYSFIGTDETDGVVHFIPCNLLEMLYAFVFSRRYGCDPDERYPVDDSWAFNTIMAGLFSVQRNIQFRDGQMVDWLIGLGLPYFGNLKTELYRV